MKEELGATFSSKTRSMTDIQNSANVEILQGELKFPGREYDKIIEYLRQQKDLPSKVEQRLSTLVLAITKFNPNTKKISSI